MAQSVPTTALEAKNLFYDFYGNPAIQQLAQKPNWSVSDPIEKKPLNITYLIKGWTNKDGSLRGAVANDPTSTIKLDEILEELPAISNHAYNLFGADDGFIVIDIEPTATDETKARLLQLPWVYAETSLSGKGIHLLLPYPYELFDAYPHAAVKPALKSPDKTWEVLINHWVTFTRNTIVNANPGTLSIDEVLAPLAQAARPPAPKLELDEIPDAEDIPFGHAVLAFMEDIHFDKALEDYNGDASSYEFAAGIFYLKQVLKLMRQFGMKSDIEPEHVVAIAYRCVENDLPSRDKWYNHYIRNRPYIIYQLECALSCILDEEKERH